MKKLLLGLAMLALLASPSFAFVQSGHLLKDQQAAGQTPSSDMLIKQRWISGDAGPLGGPLPVPSFEPLTEPVTRPIPEPGTMALASLGLLALGVSRARRRGH